MRFQKEVGDLLSASYSSLDEEEIIIQFCNSLNDTKNLMLDTNYWSYLSYKRNAEALKFSFNEYSFNLVERIYNNIKNSK